LPQKLGGQNTWQYSYPEIVPGENKTMQDTAMRDVSSLLNEVVQPTDADESNRNCNANEMAWPRSLPH
jgi:hypothetical protein